MSLSCFPKGFCKFLACCSKRASWYGKRLGIVILCHDKSVSYINYRVFSEPRTSVAMLLTVPPQPFTIARSFFFTCLCSASPMIWRVASITCRNPPESIACPPDSCPPSVLIGNSPLYVVSVLSKKGPISPLGTKPASSRQTASRIVYQS